MALLVVLCVATAVISYLLGGLNGAIMISKLFFKEDVRGHGSGNAGLTNFMRAYGSSQALLVVLIDFLKCVVACLIGGLLLGLKDYALEGRALAGFFTILGHMFPAFYKFKGGKGIMTGAAMALMLDWRIFVAVVAVFLVLTAASRIVSLGSIGAAIGLPVSSWLIIHARGAVLVLTIITGALVVFMHRGNIQRLVHGEERKLTMDQFRKR